MNKKTIVVFLAFMAFVVTSCNKRQSGEHVFTPMQCDSIDFVIEGIVSDGADSVYFDERPYAETKSYPIRDGKFSITVRQPLYKFLQIEDGSNGWMLVIVDSVPARVAVDFNTNTFIEASALNKRFNHYQQINDSIEKLMSQHMGDDDQTVYKELSKRMDDVNIQSVTENLDNVIPVYALSLLGMCYELPYDQLSEYMKDEYMFTHHPDMERAWKVYLAMRKRLPGQKFHDIELPDTAGTMHRLSEYAGQGNYVLLDFWASWCGPCMRSMPLMKELYNTYAPQGLQIIGLSFDNAHDNWVNAIRRNNLSWIHLSDVKGWESIASDTYGVRAIPETVLLSPDGEIIATGLRDEELKAKLEEIFRAGTTH